MKNILANILIDVIAIAFIAIIILWVLIFMPILIISSIVTILFVNYDFDNDKAVINETAVKFYETVMNFLVLPYKLLGVCDDFKGFCSWMGSNS